LAEKYSTSTRRRLARAVTVFSEYTTASRMSDRSWW